MKASKQNLLLIKQTLETDEAFPRYSLKRGDAFRFLFPHSAMQVLACIAVIIR